MHTYIHTYNVHTYILASLLYNILTSVVGSLETETCANDCRFGWFTMKAQLPENSALNFAGVALCFVRYVERAEVYLLLNLHSASGWHVGLTLYLSPLCLRFQS